MFPEISPNSLIETQKIVLYNQNHRSGRVPKPLDVGVHVGLAGGGILHRELVEVRGDVLEGGHEPQRLLEAALRRVPPARTPTCQHR